MRFILALLMCLGLAVNITTSQSIDIEAESIKTSLVDHYDDIDTDIDLIVFGTQKVSVSQILETHIDFGVSNDYQTLFLKKIQIRGPPTSVS